MNAEQRIATAVAIFLVLAFAAWGLVGSVLYVWHSETLQRSAAQQAQIIQQQQVRLQQYEQAIRRFQQQAQKQAQE